MKNIFRFLMAVAVLFTASCAKEDISSSIGGGEVEMTFTVDLQDLGSRAYGDGTQVNTLRYYVYDGDSYLQQLSGQKPIAVGAATTVNLVLLKGMTYNIVFWADHDGYYTYDTAAKTITVNYSTVTANEEWRDAFCKFVPAIDPATASNDDKNIVLTRPFAQLNAVATDMNTLALSGVNISKSYVTIDAYSTLNLATGDVTGLAPKTLVAGNILENGLLSMNYFLAPAEGYTPNVTFTFENNKDIDFGASFTYVPLKRNYRTNIIGSLLSKSTDFTVTIEKNFYEPDQEPEELFKAAVLGGEVTLTEDVELTQPLNVQSTMTLNLNGHTITTTEERAGRHHYAIYNNGNLTITGSGNIEARGIKNFGDMVVDGDLTITNVDTDGGAAIWNEGKLTINKGTFATNNNAGQGSYGAALNTRANGEAVVNGGNFYAYSQLTYAIVNEGKTTINNATVVGKHGAVAGAESNDNTVINGGSFELMENPGVSDHCTYKVSAIYGGTFSLGNNTDSGARVFCDSNIAEGYKTEEKNGLYYVVAEGATVVATTADFSNALTSGGEIILIEDVDLTKIDLTTPTPDVVINANGNTITTSSNYGVQVKAGKNITLKNAIVAITVEGNYITYAAGFKVENGDYQGNTISLENCEIRMCNTDWAYAVNMPASVKNLNLVIDGCTLEGALALQCWGDNNTITITNSNLICNYTTSSLYTSYCVALQGEGTNKAENNTLNISGCNFSYTGIDNYNSPIDAIYNWSNTDANNTNTITVVDCTYDNKVTPFN